MDYKLIDFFIMLASLSAVIVSAYTVFSQRRHNHLTVKPLPTFSNLLTETEYKLVLRNNGMGPMVIQSLEKHIGDVVRHRLEAEDIPDVTCNPHLVDIRYNEGACISPGDENLITKLTFATGDQEVTPEEREAMLAALETMVAKLSYTDVYGNSYPIKEHKYLRHQ